MSPVEICYFSGAYISRGLSGAAALLQRMASGAISMPFFCCPCLYDHRWGREDKRGVIVAFGGVVFGVEIATSCSYGRGFLLSDRLKAISR